MFHSRQLNARINRIHERALRIVYQDYKTEFKELLRKDNAVTIHEKNLQVLAIEMYKVKIGLAPTIMKEIFEINKNTKYNLRKISEFIRGKPHTVTYGTQSLSYLGPKLWEMIPNDIKNSRSVTKFKSKIKKWTLLKCPRRLCIDYIPQVVFY